MTTELVKKSPRRGRPEHLSSEQAGNRTVVFGLHLLKAVVDARRPMALTEVAQQFGISASRTHRYLSSLCEAGFVRKDAETGRYDVGVSAIELGVAASSRVSSMQVITSAIEDLTARTGLVSYVCIWGSNGPTIIRREQGAVQTAVRIQEGTNLSMLSASGQIFMAFLPEGQTRDTLLRDIAEWNKTRAPNDQITMDQVCAMQKRVRQTQIARSTGIQNPTWRAFSAPVFRHGKLALALTVIGVSKTFDTRINGKVATTLKETAERVSSTDISL